MPDSSGLRVSDSEREQLAGELREHMLAGRLSSDEFEERVAKAYAAVTRAELEELKRDLPMGVATLEVELAKRKSKLRRRIVQEGGGAVGISAVCVAIWAADGAGGSFWPAWVIVVMLLPLIRNAWALIGPDPDLESVEAHLESRRAHRLERERRRHRRSHHGPPRPPGLSR
jgi:hypothetical protein